MLFVLSIRLKFCPYLGAGTLFQIQLCSVQNCIQWTSSNVVRRRVEDVVNIIMSSLKESCNCEFSRDPVVDGGFQCFSCSEDHVTFRARLRATDQSNSLELMTYLEIAVVNACRWLVNGQYLRLNLSCNLIITDIHSPECIQSALTTVDDNDLSLTAHTTVPSAVEPNTSFNDGYLAWALFSSTLVVLSMTAFCIMLSVKVLRKKRKTHK